MCVVNSLQITGKEGEAIPSEESGKVFIVRVMPELSVKSVESDNKGKQNESQRNQGVSIRVPSGNASGLKWLSVQDTAWRGQQGDREGGMTWRERKRAGLKSQVRVWKILTDSLQRQ